VLDGRGRVGRWRLRFHFFHSLRRGENKRQRDQVQDLTFVHDSPNGTARVSKRLCTGLTACLPARYLVTEYDYSTGTSFASSSPLANCCWRTAAAPSNRPSPIDSTAVLGTIIIEPFSFSPS